MASTLDTPVILAATPDIGSLGSLTTTSNILTLIGLADANTTIAVFDGANQIGTTTTNSLGEWSFSSPSLADGLHTFTVIASASGNQSAASAALSITVQADIASFSALTDQWAHPISINGMPFFVENANTNGNAPWAISEPDSHTLRFVLEPGDTWTDNGSHRTEVAGETIYAPNTTINTSYQFMVEPGPVNQYWTVLGQFHSDDSSSITQSLTADYPVFAVELTGKNASGQGDYIGIWADYTLPGQTTPTAITSSGTASWGMIYVSPTPIVRGQYYSVQIEASFQNNANGFLEVWLNGVQVVNYHGPLGYGAGNYWKEGIYQDSSDTTQTIAADYKNLVISPTPGAPTILSESVKDGWVTLSGTAEANSTVTVFDGAATLGTATANGAGAWTYATIDQLSVGSHALTAKATDSAGNVSAASSAMNVRITEFLSPTPDDLNGDGQSDILWRNNNGDTVLWNSTGSSGFSVEDLGVVGTSYQIAGVSDFNGDGKADVLWRNSNGDTVLWNSAGSGGFSADDLGVVGTSYQIAGVDDFNGDGKADILWRNSNGDTVLWNSTGSSGFSVEDLGVVGTCYQIAGVGDFNGDGKADILWRNATNGDTVLWNSNGAGGFSTDDLGVVGTGYQIAGVGDFNGDGKSDILWRNATNGDTVLWNSTASGGFSMQDLGVVATSYQVAQVGDFNGSGKDGILWRNSNGDVVLWNSASSGGFTTLNLGVVGTSYQVESA
jgi:hypothetical protein